MQLPIFTSAALKRGRFRMFEAQTRTASIRLYLQIETRYQGTTATRP